MAVATAQQAVMDGAVRYLVSNYNPKGNKVGWLMMASILIEAWDLYSIAFVLIYIKAQYNPDPLLLGLAAAGTQGGALIGALLGGWLSDKIGRRVMFLSTMVMFIVLALAQAFVPNMVWLVVIRFLLGVPLGSDISNGYTYIMESMPKGDREVMGNRWQFMFAIGEVMTLAVIALFLLADMPREWVWRVTLGLGAVPALIILIMRHDLPETAVWLIRQGRFREAKQVTLSMYGDKLDILPDVDVTVEKPRPTAFLADISKDPIRWRATQYGWIACFCQASEFSTFGFYLPVLFVMLGVAGDLGIVVVTMCLYVIAAISGSGFLPFVAAAMLWGHYWAASNCMTIPTVVAKPEYRGTASGFAYMFVKLPSFLAIFLFPSLFTEIGQAASTLFVAIFPLTGLSAAILILPEIYGYEHDS